MENIQRALEDAGSSLDRVVKCAVFLADSAPVAASVIHTDFEKGFIRTETVGYTEFVANGGWKGAREKGAVRSEGKE